MGNLKRAFLKITGRVQGVFYRQSARERAKSLKLSGWIKNLPDGSVEAEIEGIQEQIEAFVVWSKEGPPRARVENVEITWVESHRPPSQDNLALELRIIG